jgi:hypothetical protein
MCRFSSPLFWNLPFPSSSPQLWPAADNAPSVGIPRRGFKIKLQICSVGS